jgi:eukaryotic-like serine/threonine-protein kinase
MGRSGPHIIDGRYAIYDEIASGGMATVHFGCSLGAGSFSRIVAIKRLHAHLARENEFVRMFLDEARVAARIRHPNVAPTLDVVATDREIFLVMEYVHGESLSKLLAAMRARRDAARKDAAPLSSRNGAPSSRGDTAPQSMPLPIAAAIAVGLLGGLHAAHEATDERGQSLQIVHRDVSPQNLIVGADGVARIVDFGVAKAVGRLQQTQTGEIKGKFGYMAPEQVNGSPVTRAADLYAAGVVLWEALTGRPLFTAEGDVQLAAQVLLGDVQPPSRHAQGIPSELDAIVMCALDREPSRRFRTARDMAHAIQSTVPVANASRVAEYVQGLSGPVLQKRERRLAEIETDWARRNVTPSRLSAVPAPAREPQRDASTRAVTYAAGSQKTPVRARPDPSSLVDTQDRQDRREVAQARLWRPLNVWLAVAAVAMIATATVVVDRREEVQEWLHPAAAAPSSEAAVAVALRASSASPVAPARQEPAVPVTVPVEDLPVATPPSIPIEALPHAVEAVPEAGSASRPQGTRSQARMH